MLEIPLVNGEEIQRIIKKSTTGSIKTKAHVPDMRHRAILHSSFGIYLAEQVFGTLIENSDGDRVSVRDIAEAHIIEDLGFIPTVQDYLNHMEAAPWMSGTKRGGTKTKHIPLVD